VGGEPDEEVPMDGRESQVEQVDQVDQVAPGGASGAPAPADASGVVAAAVERAALERVAMTGPHWIDLVVHATQDRTIPPTSTSTVPEPLGKRLGDGAPLTPLADPATGGESLAGWGVGPSTVGDLLEARDTDGRRLAGELELQCAIEAARLAPRLADQLAHEHPGLADRLAAERVGPPGAAGRHLDAAAILVAEVAARLAVALVVLVREHLAPVPLPVRPPTAGRAPAAGQAGSGAG
jgi:hypothetical protein